VFARWGWFQAHARRVHHRSASRPGLLERALQCLRFLEPDVRALLVKDVRMFWRDTTQWAQSVLLFGLLGVYILNLRHFSQQLGSAFWVHLVSYLNLGACSLNLATLTTRFAFPQFSLEGKRLWIIGLAPLGLDRLVRVKYWLATGTSLVVTVGLMILSCHMLRMPTMDTLFFAASAGAMTFALNGVAVGLGVLYPNFKEENPSKIVSGFGGTFCLVLSFLYILTSVVILAFAKSWSAVDPAAPIRSAACVLSFLALSAALAWLPLRLAFQRLRTFEA
jgi:ABC-2 type transport system permease protein